jgi:hypothetical protein
MSKVQACLGVGALLAAAASAQIVAPGRILGFGTDPTNTLPPAILRQTLCTAGARVCPSGLPAPPSPWGGGAAYNAAHRSVWHTQGTRMAEIQIDDCRLLCSAAANLTLGANSLATGLDVSEGRRELWQLESIPGHAALTIWHTRSCPIAVISTCRFMLPTAQHIAGAVALDERHGLVMYAASVFSAANPNNVILVARAGDPCNLACRFDVTGCGTIARLNAITGMAYDACEELLYITDGTQTAIYTNRGATEPCQFRAVGCCPASPNLPNYRWHGLDVEPRHPAGVGTSCLSERCRNCAAMELVAVGDPTIGNPSFRLDLVNGPTGGFFQLGLAGGPCRPAGFPIFCGRWHTDVGTLILLPVLPIGGGVPCDGSALVGIPIPHNYSLCGAVLCAQGLVLCPPLALPLALGLTNAVQFTID